MTHSNVQGGLGSTGFTAGAGNINLDPLFVLGDRDYHLQETSPCVDAGSNAAVPAGLTTDFEGDPRIFACADRGTRSPTWAGTSTTTVRWISTCRRGPSG